MKILLIGKNGQLGWELQRTLATLGELVAIDYPEINLVDADQTRQIVRAIHPEAIVCPAAYTAVDRAESEPDLAWAVNAIAPGILAEEAKALGAPFIHYSTDYVFSGDAQKPYVETDPTGPINEYGRSKLGGEQAIQQVDGAYWIFRTSWVYSDRQGGFVTKVLEWARKQEVMRVVTDQVASPTWCRMLAEATAQLLSRKVHELNEYVSETKGIYHLAGSGSASRFEWARKILELDPDRHEQTVKEILPSLTAEFPSLAARPLYSALDCSKFNNSFGLCLPAWQEALRMLLERV